MPSAQSRIARASWALAICLVVSAGCDLPAPPLAPELLAIQPSTRHTTQIVMLGTGTPGAEPDRSGPATAIVIGTTTYLVDFGPGAVRQAVRAAERHGMPALLATNLRVAFLTHLHSDHTAGYPDLILTPWVLGRPGPLEVFGPPGTTAMTEALLEAYREDIRIRIEGPERLPSTPGIVNAHDVVPGVVYEDDQVTVEAFAVPHGVWEHAYGYKFTSADRTIVISGDTGPFDGLAEIATGADVLIHEAYGTGGFNQRSPVNQRYHGTFHTSGTKVGEIATAAGVGMVVLYHQLHLFGESPEALVAEVRASFDGRVVYGRDLEIY